MQNLPHCGLETIPRDRENPQVFRPSRASNGKVRKRRNTTQSDIVCAYLFLDFPRLNHSTSFVKEISLFLLAFHSTPRASLILLLLSRASSYPSIYQITFPFDLVARVETLLSARNAKTALSKGDKRVTRVITVSIASSLSVICPTASI